MITKKTDVNLLHPSFRLKALATTAQRPVEKDLFPAKIGNDVDTFQFAIQDNVHWQRALRGSRHNSI